MNHGELCGEPQERLVEVLLEEQFRGLRATGRPSTSGGRTRRWLAAASVLLGLGVVVGVMTLRGPGDAANAPVQDPKPAPKEPEVVVPKTHAEFLALAGLVQRVQLQVARSWEGGFVGVPDAVAAIAEPQRVRAFVASLPVFAAFLPNVVSTVPQSGSVEPTRLHPDAQVTLELRDGRVVRGTFFGQLNLMGLGELQPAIVRPGPCRDQLRALHAQAIENGRLARGVAYSFDELARMAATARSIQCPPLPPGTVAQHLGRFLQLERLDQVLATSLATSGPVAIDVRAPARLAEFAVLPHLRHLGMPGAGLSDLDAADMVRLPGLTSLRLDGGLGNLGEGAGVLVRRLDALALASVFRADELVRAVVAAGRIRRVALASVGLSADTFAALVAMPTLVELELAGTNASDSQLAQVLQAKAKLERLRLQSSQVSPTGLRTLVAMPSLRELDLRRASLRPGDLDELAKALPDCRIRRPGEPDDDAGSGPR